MEEMRPYFSETYGNASSLHSFGREAKEALDSSRDRLASCIPAKPEELIFTSGGTESNNMAIKGVAYSNVKKGRHIIVSSIEHDCIMNSCEWLREQGFDVTYLPVDEYGLVDAESVERSIRKDTTLVSVMHANNEIGTIEPIADIGKVCKEHGVYFHTDACQSFGKLPIDPVKQGTDLITINGHKMYGPKGVGALFIREGVNILPWQHGGGHEFGLRSSTENVPGIVGFAKAAELCRDEMEGEKVRLTNLRDRLIGEARERVETAYLNGHKTLRLPNNANLGFHGLEGEAIRLQLELDELGIAVSTGSACSSNQASNKPSHVLSAIGLNPIEARGALRITLGRYNTGDEVDYFVDCLPKTIGSLRPISSVRF